MSGASTSFEPTHNLSDEIFIRSAEIPGTDADNYAQHRATTDVNAHKRGLFNVFPKFGIWHAKKGSKRKRGDAAHDVEKGAESEGAVPCHPPGLDGGGGGVLSALLSLHKNDPEHSEFGSSSLETPTLGRVPRSFGLPDLGVRPATQRSSVDEFGAPVTSAGNIADADAPTATTVAPNSKRPSYRPSRYSYDGTTEVVSASSSRPRPHSMHVELPLHREVVMPASRSEPASPDESATASAVSLWLPQSFSTVSLSTTPGGTRRQFTTVLRDLPRRSLPRSWLGSVPISPTSGRESDGESLRPRDTEKYWARAEERERRKAQKMKRRKADIFVIICLSLYLKRWADSYRARSLDMLQKSSRVRSLSSSLHAR